MATNPAQETQHALRQAATAQIYPFLRYNDAAAAIDWLVNAFGFEKLMVAPHPDGTIAHAELNIGPAIIMLGQSGERRTTLRPRDITAVEQGLYVYVADLEAHYQRAKAAGAEIVQDLHDTDHGSREYAAVDVEGYYWGFGTHHPESSS